MATQTPTAPPDPISAPLTWQQIQDQAEQQAGATIAGENAPLTTQVGVLGGQEKSSGQAISSEFGSLLPYVQGSAGAVEGSYGNALSMEQSIFQAANTRMNQLHQNMAAEAQQLAQQIGGPVGTGQFTQALEPYEAAMPAGEASSMLHSLGIAQAGVQEANQFAGQVFPALQTEEQAKNTQFYEDQIKTLQGQIDTNNASKSDLVNKNVSDLTNQERQYKLQLAQQSLDKLKAKRDWAAAQASIHSTKLRDALATQAAKRAGIQIGLQKQQFGLTKERTQAEIAHMSQADKLAARREGLSEAEFAQRAAHEKATAKIGAARVSDSISKDAISLVQAAMGGGKPVSRTYRAYVPGKALPGLKPPAGSYYDPKRKQYYRIGHETMTAAEWQQSTGEGQTPITDPNKLYNYVRGSLPQLGTKATINLIRAQTGQKNWSPGQQTTYTGHDLQVMPISELKGLARDHGYKFISGAKTQRQALVDWLLSRVTAPEPGANP